MTNQDGNLVDVHVLLTRDQAWAVAELCKRIGWTEIRQLSADDEETDRAQVGLMVLAKELARVGFSPR
jgi:hypothetical protein